MPDQINTDFFRLFNEIGIIEQLSRVMFEARLPKGMLVSHFSVLNHLIRVADGRTPLELARAFQVAKTTMTHTLTTLEKHGLIEVRPNPQDKRSKQVWISPSGREFRDQAIASLSPDFAILAEKFSIDKVRKMLPPISELRAVLDGQREQSHN